MSSDALFLCPCGAWHPQGFVCDKVARATLPAGHEHAARDGHGHECHGHSHACCDHDHGHDDHGHDGYPPAHAADCHAHEHENGGHDAHAHDGCCCGHDAPQAVDWSTLAAPSATRAVYRILNMDCPMEEALIRKKLATVPGITGLGFNLMQRVLTVEHELPSTASIEAALKAIGFCDVVEVAIGADLCTVDEAHDFLEEVPEKLDFMATSCCPAWSMMAKTAFPGLAKNISMTMTPMVFTARMMKQKDPEARMCFIGPCAAKKLEASRRTVRSDVDFVLTFEELAGIIEAKDVDTSLLEVDEAEALHAASAAGRGFAQSGGVAKAVADKIKEWHPDMDVKIASAQGLAECKKLLMLAKAGKYNGYLLEGMGCPGGCIGGAGTIADPARTAIQLNKYVKEAPFADPEQSPFMSEIHVLKDDPDFEL